MRLRQHSYSLPAFFSIMLLLAAVTGAAKGDKQKSSSSSGKSAEHKTATHAEHHSSGGAAHSGSADRSPGRTASAHSSGGGGSTSHSSGHSSSASAPSYTRKSSSGSSAKHGEVRAGSTTTEPVNAGSGSQGHHEPKEGRHVSGTGGNNGPAHKGRNDDHRRAGNSFRTTSRPGRHSGNINGRHYEPVRHVSNVGGHRVYKDDRGKVRDIHARGLVIHRDLHGDRRFVAVHGGSRVVGLGTGRGFVERRYYTRPGRVYVQRTYIIGGRPYAYAYRSYRYRGIAFYRYAPAYYYRPGFYGWAYNPWAVRVSYHWGWFGDPWYPHYGYYFRPYPVYPSASLWLTDYLLAENLRLAYEARANANAAAAAAYSSESVPPPQTGEAALSPEVKQLIADEVQRQLDVERAAAAQPAQQSQAFQQQAEPPSENAQVEDEVPPALDPNQIVFIVSTNLDLQSDSGECSVTPGDVLMRIGNTPDENNRIAVKVASSKKGDCAVNTNSAVEVTDLQEMHNHFREKLDSGLKSLADNQGKNGLPVAPDTGTVAGEVPPAQPDANAEGELQNRQKQADETEREVQKGPPGD